MGAECLWDEICGDVGWAVDCAHMHSSTRHLQIIHECTHAHMHAHTQGQIPSFSCEVIQ